MEKLDVKIFWILVGVFVLQIVWYYPQLPETMATHFNASGRADGWSGKQGFMVMYIGVTILIVAPFLAFRFWIHKIPNKWINLPRKEYWLKPENREGALNLISSRMLWLGNATLLFLMALFHLTYAANIGPEKQLGSAFWYIFITYMVVTIGWIVFIILPFLKTKQDQ